jgi:hypothetical protein
MRNNAERVKIMSDHRGEDRAEDAAREHDRGAELHDRNAAHLERHGASRDAARERRDAVTRRDAATRERADPGEANRESTT